MPAEFGTAKRVVEGCFFAEIKKLIKLIQLNIKKLRKFFTLKCLECDFVELAENSFEMRRE